MVPKYHWLGYLQMGEPGHDSRSMFRRWWWVPRTVSRHGAPGRPSLYGSTCDSIDFMPRFSLPESDYIEVGMLRGYGGALRSDFNEFGVSKTRADSLAHET